MGSDALEAIELSASRSGGFISASDGVSHDSGALVSLPKAKADINGIKANSVTAYYNEIDPYAAQWLRNLIAAGHIAPGDVDERSIVNVRPDDLRGYTQCHFFAGIGGWSLALRLAEWPDDRLVWTGSCPCQPLSSAGKRKGHADQRHLWPAFYGLIAQCRPAMVFGEQVASKDGREWLAAVRADLEGLGYAVGAADLCAASLGAHHARHRLWWVCTNTISSGWEGIGKLEGGPWSPEQFEGLVQQALQSAVPAGRMRRLSDGVSARVGKLRAFGNAIVPQVAAEFIKASCAN
jgi:DNA (cytosine-5)-methyltransferase 1